MFSKSIILIYITSCLVREDTELAIRYYNNNNHLIVMLIGTLEKFNRYNGHWLQIKRKKGIIEESLWNKGKK